MAFSFKKIASAACAIAAAASVTTGATGVASAHTGNLVTFGDSFTANPDQNLNTFRGIPAIVKNYPQNEGCLQAPNNWPRLLAAKTGRPLDDFSCTAATSRAVLHKVHSAVNKGRVNDNSTVIIAVGMNNFGGFGILDGVPIVNPAAVRKAYIADIKAAADKIRSVAPKAEIIISGALPTVDHSKPGVGLICSVNAGPGRGAGTPVPFLKEAEVANRANQRAAAEAIGAKFVDLLPVGEGHDTCAPEKDRWVSGLVMVTSPNQNMMFHPTQAGSQAYADTIASQMHRY